MLDYKIFVMSRHRSHNMPTIRALLPSAYVCVDEREADDYAKHIPEDKLVLHKPTECFADAYNETILLNDAPIHVHIGDDFVGVHSLISGRYITDPEEILGILENSMHNCHDLGLTAFTFAGSQNASIVKPEMRPIKPIQAIMHAYGVMNEARYRQYTHLPGRDDIDYALQTFLEDRIVYADCRFMFDCGEVYAGRGGNVGLITAEDFRESSEKIKKKWGKSISYQKLAWVKNKSKASMKFQVTRTSKLAQK